MQGLEEAVLERIPAALHTYLMHPGSLEFRSCLRGRTDEASIADVVEKTMLVLPERLGTKELLVEGRMAPAGPLPTRVLVTPDAVAVAVGHGHMDGGAILEYVTALLVSASGGTPKRDDRSPIRFPTIRGVRSVGLAGLRRFAATRSLPVPSPVATRSPSADDLALRTAQFDLVRIEHRTVTVLLGQPTTGPASPMSHVASVGIRALRRLYSGAEDLPVIVPVDVRRFVGNKRVLGNFMGVATPASLLGSDWDAGVLSARNLASVTSGTAMVANAYAMARWILRRPRSIGRRTTAPGPGAVSVFVPMLSAPRETSVVQWRADADRVLAFASIGRWPSGTSLSIMKFGKDYYLSVWDESGYFDLQPGALAAAIETELDLALDE